MGFTACWLFASGKDGIAALSLKRTLDVGSYQTVWAMLHRLRAARIRPGRERLVGTVEVDETYIGGRDSGGKPWQRPGRLGLDGHRSGDQGTPRLRPMPARAAG